MALFGFKDERTLTMFALIVVALAGGYLFYEYIYNPQRERLNQARHEIDSLQTIVDAAKRDLASGTVEDLRRKVEVYKASLELMRRLVPASNEVPALIDDITTKAKVRGVTLGKFQPLSREPGSPFDTYRYQMEVYGHYDQVGEFLADVASLPRIVVPERLTLQTATQAASKLLGDTLGGLLLADFSIRTFVKAPPPPTAQAAAAGGGNSARR
jgi:type IV pilus assembly protein PilO